MLKLLKVSAIFLLFVPSGLIVHEARADSATAVVSCDLLTPTGPRARSLQFGSTVTSRRGFVAAPGAGTVEVRTKTCAQVLSEVTAEGFTLETFDVAGRNRSTGVWFFISSD
jgi:hypothetical protein